MSKLLRILRVIHHIEASPTQQVRICLFTSLLPLDLFLIILFIFFFQAEDWIKCLPCSLMWREISKTESFNLFYL